uniref:Uncharacterized protein n=1 Tax=Solanum tuberosum TaxID=4113 RepID=M1E035_SOLTU
MSVSAVCFPHKNYLTYRSKLDTLCACNDPNRRYLGKPKILGKYRAIVPPGRDSCRYGGGALAGNPQKVALGLGRKEKGISSARRSIACESLVKPTVTKFRNKNQSKSFVQLLGAQVLHFDTLTSIDCHIPA